MAIVNTRVIDLAELRGQDEFPAYAAIYSQTAASPFVLSPSVMRWSGEIMLSRLDDCRLFWMAQKKKRRCKLTLLFEQLLQHHYGEGFIAVFGNHPWQCLLYLHYQWQHAGQGIYLLQSRLDQNIYRSLGWDCWFAPLQQLAQHLQSISARGFRAEALQAQQGRLQRFIERVGVAGPEAMRRADANSLTRRFGKWLGLAWQWTFTESADLQTFPWIRHAPEPLPRIRRDLEYPVSQWCHIELLLREDLERLCSLQQVQEGMHINRMRWAIRLFSDDLVEVDLSFRHPYSLHRDRPEFTTALYQARYVYEGLMHDLERREHDLDLPESMPFNGWTLEICERLMLAPQLWALFPADSDAIDYQQIMSLQNKLPVAFESFEANAANQPEQSFRYSPIGRVGMDDDLDAYAWIAGAINKPLFYLPEPEPIEAPTGVEKIFLERDSGEWWLGSDGLQSIRDYFILKDRDGRLSWVFRNHQGAWFKQGEFC